MMLMGNLYSFWLDNMTDEEIEREYRRLAVRFYKKYGQDWRQMLIAVLMIFYANYHSED